MDFDDGKRQHEQQSSKSSRSASPDSEPGSPVYSETYHPLQRTPPPSRPGPPQSPPVPTKPVAPVTSEPAGPLPLMPCAVCGRTFVPSSLSKHVKICEKMMIKKRKTFDSSRQRREGTDLEQYLPKNFGLPENSPFIEKSPPTVVKPTPKPKVQSVRSAMTKPTADLQKCPHCNRAFGVRAFERHVEWCADKAKILPAAPAQPPPHIADAKQRLNARTQYKAPPVRGRRSSQSREKSSNSRSASVESTRGSSPPPTREYGDCKRGRTRASESISSNDCHEDNSPHVPVIRNSRNTLNSSSGDANVRARQARLAKDISNSRIDDNYDPFASAAKQMKELMSSDKNNPKKVPNISRDYNRTLPNLKQAKEKSLTLSHPRQENIKLMKDTINKTYQKTPSLQRMKSFGSTNNDNTCSFGGRCSSFRLNKNDKKPTQKLNSTFTKSSKENISISDRTQINRSNSMSRSFSSYSNSCYSTPKLKDKIPKLSQSMHHGFQRTTTKQPLKLEKVTKVTEKSDAVTLHSIFNFDKNSLMTDSNYIDPRLINENDNLPINVNTLLNNPDIISSMESLLTTENLPAKFESFSTVKNNNNHETSMTESLSNIDEKNNNKNDVLSPRISDLSSQYNKIMSSLEQSITSKTSGRDDNSLCEDFDLEEFMTSFDEEIHKQKSANKRTYSSTTRIVAHSNICSDDRRSDTKVVNSPKIVNSRSNGMIPVNKSTSLIFSHNNITGDKILPSPVKRSTSLLDSIQKKTAAKAENSKSRQNVDQLEEDIMQSLKDFDTFYESQRNDSGPQSRELNCNNRSMYNDTIKRNTRKKNDVKTNKSSNASNGNCTPNGKSSNDSAYSSLNRISPSKLTLCNTKESNGVTSLERIPASSDTSGTGRDDARSISSDEFLAMERSTELNGQVPPPELFKQAPAKTADKQASRRSSQTSPTWRSRHELSSSGSESSLFRTKKEVAAAPRLSRFCHECGSKFPVDTAKFCIECGVKRLAV